MKFYHKVVQFRIADFKIDQNVFYLYSIEIFVQDFILDDVVQEGETIFAASEGQDYTISLVDTFLQVQKGLDADPVIFFIVDGLKIIDFGYYKDQLSYAIDQIHVIFYFTQDIIKFFIDEVFQFISSSNLMIIIFFLLQKLSNAVEKTILIVFTFWGIRKRFLLTHASLRLHFLFNVYFFRFQSRLAGFLEMNR